MWQNSAEERKKFAYAYARSHVEFQANGAEPEHEEILTRLAVPPVLWYRACTLTNARPRINSTIV